MKELGMARSVFTASAVAVALVLAGCGGGGDSDDRADRADAAVAGLEAQIAALEGQVEAYELQVAALMGDLSTANGNVMRLEGELSTANGNVMRLEGELATANGDVMRLEGELATAGGENSRLEGELATANGNVMRLEGELATANGDVMRLEGELADETKRADDLQAQIDATGDAQAIAKAKAVNTALRATDSAPAAPTVSVEASTAGVLSAKSTGYTDAAEAPDVGGLPSGWRGRMLTKGDSMLVIYSNIADAKGTPLDDLYDSRASSGQSKAYLVHRSADNSAQNAVDGAISMGSISWEHVKRANMTLSTTVEDETTTTTFDGSARGVAGTFSCTGTSPACTPPTFTDGEATGTASGAWSFRPDDANALAAISDDSYVSVGWSLVDNEDNTYGYVAFGTANVMGGGYGADNSGDVPAAVSGDATYTGGAAGKYTLLDEVEDTAHGGHWTATASLTADFDADEDEANEDDTETGGIKVSGSISDFMVDGASQSAWKVTLRALDTADTTDGQQNGAPFDADAEGRVAVWSRGGAASSNSGSWTAMFHGDATGDAQPSAVTGNFNAAVGNRAYIEGAFAAEKDEE